MNWLKKIWYRGDLYHVDEKQHTIISQDVYDAIKEIAKLSYRIVELEVRVGNLEHTIKLIISGEVK